MKYAQFFFVFITLLSIQAKQTLQYIDVETMDTWQNRIDLRDSSWRYLSSLILKSHSGVGYKTSRTKTMIISPPSGYGLFGAVKTLDLRPNGADYLSVMGSSKGDYFTYSNPEYYQKRNIYSKENVYMIYSPGQINVTFITGPSFPSTNNYYGFEIIFTVQANSTKCRSKYDFYCDNKRCISSALKCDGHNHCGDRSDQKNCDPKTGKNVGWIVGGVFFAFIALACAVYIMMRRSSRSTSTETVITHPPPMASYPPSYPQSGAGYPAPPPPYSQGINNPGYH